MKNLGILQTFDDIPIVGSESGKVTPSSLERQKIYNIVGLGGESEDFFMKIANQ